MPASRCGLLSTDLNRQNHGAAFLQRMKILSARICAPRATAEQFSTLRGYLDSRHSDGGMADMTVLDYRING